jgi:hypothetical protein
MQSHPRLRTRWLALAVLPLCLLVGLASAESWENVHTSSNRTDWMDRDSLKMRHGLWSAWTRTQFNLAQRRTQDGVQFRSARSLVYFDCAGKRMGIATIVFYSDPKWIDSIGTVSEPDIKKLHMDPSPPEQGDQLLEAGCSHT